MALRLEAGLPHQKKAIEAITKVFDGVHFTKNHYSFINPAIDLHSETLIGNIEKIQRNIDYSLRGSNAIDKYLNLDIKMETGTGKTYVYTQAIYELNRKYGLNKFIILVPSLAVKAGTKQFIKADYVKRHFKSDCNYNTEIELHVLDSKKSKKKGREPFPHAVDDFVSGSDLISHKIHVLLVNMQLFQDKKGGMLTKEYDNAVEGFYKPSEAIKATNPVVIIDEPHRFSKENKTFEFINNEICPQCIIRFGATFPDIERKVEGKKIKVKDYQNLIYNLSSYDAFNQNLIKGIRKEHLPSPTGENIKVKLLSTKNKANAQFQLITEKEKRPSISLAKDNSLALLHPAFDGVYINSIGKNVELSTGQVLERGTEIYTDIYSSSYQDLMLKLALKRHFETERENFRRKYKIKTLCLFFIDDIDSYRPEKGSGRPSYLKDSFEKLLKEKIEDELCLVDQLIGEGEDLTEYKLYLEASRADIAATHSGYFARDNDDSDEEIARQVDEILIGKEKLLSIREPNGHFNTRRFIFSKWTLKEGWDNPNVFTIAKLRSSGSENSKLQEVGRGLRLPVDENGNRMSQEEFFLNYIVDFTEKDFAEKLVDEIHGDIEEVSKVSEQSIEKLAEKLGLDYSVLLGGLMFKGYIDKNREIKVDKRDEFFAEYPDLLKGISSNKIIDRNKKQPVNIKIRTSRYNEIKELWEKINQKYFITYENLDNKYLFKEVSDIIHSGIYSKSYVTSKRDVVRAFDNNLSISQQDGVSLSVENILPYNIFLKRTSQLTSLPIKLLHSAFVNYAKHHTIQKDFFNENTVSQFIIKFNEWKKKKLMGRLSYQKVNLPVHPTALTNKDGKVREVVTQGRLGTKILPGEAQNKYLYDVVAFDSDLEKENILSSIEEVIVFGKIPKNSIRIPIIDGGTYSPDFMYVVKKNDGSKELNIVIESKDVQTDSNLREDEQIRIKCAKEFFKQLQLDGYDVKFKKQLQAKKIKGIIDEVLGI